MNWEQLNEDTIKDLEKTTWQSIKDRVIKQHLKSVYLGCDDNGRLYFKTTSGTTPGKWWNQQVEFKDMSEAIKMLNQKLFMRRKLAVKMLIDGSVSVWCDDLSWHYYGKYTAWKNGYGLQKETRRPTRNNVQEDHIACKHILSCFYLIPSISDQILKDYKKKKILPNFRERMKNKNREE